ncbi:hypothetical protein CR513_15834, partial [Mucuna pruriens]
SSTDPLSRTVTIKKEIFGIRQHSGETLHEYWERFNKLCATCPHHQIREQLLIQYFYESLTIMDRSMIDAASGGALMEKMPRATRYLISNMERAGQPRMVNEIDVVDNLRLENQLAELTTLIRQLAVGQHQPSIVARVYDICNFVEHPTNMCLTLQETKPNHPERVEAIGPSQGPYVAQRFELAPNAPQGQAAAIESASSRQLTISRGPDEAANNKQSGVPAKYELQQHAVPTKHEHHHPRPQDTNRTTSQYCEPFTVDRVQQPSFANNSKS